MPGEQKETARAVYNKQTEFGCFMSLGSSIYLPEPVQAVCLFCLKQLPALLNNLFENADDVLFELADKAGSNIEQTLYFDSMRELRIKREDIEIIVQDHIRSAFSHMAADSDAMVGASVIVGELSLLQHEVVEEDVAIRSMVSKVENRYLEPLDHLTRRLNDLLSARQELTTHANPVGGHQLCEAFREGCKELDLDIRVKLVLYKLFDKHVLGDLDSLYSGANKILVKAGILPKIRSELLGASNTQRQTGPKTFSKHHYQPAGDSQENPRDEMFEMLRELLAVKQSNTSAHSGVFVPEQNGFALAREDLLTLLSQLQKDEKTGIQQVQSSVPVAAGQPDLAGIVAQRVLKLEGKARTVASLDRDIINLVSMLFEFVLEDAQLSAPIKVLLARLQIPMLKVALLDNAFFSQKKHPARRLLNELAHAAMGWSEVTESKKDPLFRKITEITEQITNEFENNPQFFQLLLDDFMAFSETEHRRAVLIEKRTREAEEGLGKIQQARAQVSDIINSRTVGRELPEMALQLIQDGWSNYLFYLLVREGKDSDAWNDAVKTLDDLIWSVQPKSSAGEQKKLLQMMPALLAKLRAGLDVVSFSTLRMREIFKSLELFHKQNLRSSHGLNTSTTPKVAAVDRDVVVNPLQVEKEDSVFDDNHYLELADQMRAGAWVEFISKDAPTSRAKLAGVIKSTGKYIFVNRLGLKVAEKSRFSLAVALRDGGIKLLEDGLLFDSALESVIVQLRRDKED